MKCHCIKRIMENFIFRHYNSKEDILGSEFDDFGYNIFKDNNGNEHKMIAHCYLGLYESGYHCYEERPENWEWVRFELDNSIIPKIKEYYCSKERLEKKIHKFICESINS